MSADCVKTNISWKDIGGMKSIKRDLQEFVQYPVKHSLKLDLPAPRGVLMYGPPGCGKTLLAKAIPNKCNVNFIYIKGIISHQQLLLYYLNLMYIVSYFFPQFLASELLAKSLAESNTFVTEVFTKARADAPCVVFFDNFDLIAVAGRESPHHQILTEMGRMGQENVFVIGATNRPGELVSYFVNNYLIPFSHY